VKWLKLCLAVLLLPACVALTISSWRVARQLAFGPGGAGTLHWALGAGYGLWLAVFAVLPRPMRTYVLGHELTHALWAWLMGARVSGLRVRKSGGQVRTSKTNWFIVLAPYFFPFYAMLFIAGFFAAQMFADLSRYLWVLFFFVGLGWSFHVTFTVMMLFFAQQPDVKSQGWLFSLVTIYCMNLLVMALTAAALSRSVTLTGFVMMLGGDVIAAYGWTLDNFVALWHRLFRHGIGH
jgi:hypothetical protein